MCDIEERVKNFTKGSIIAGYRDKVTGEFSRLYTKENLITYSGMDVLSSLIGGNGSMKISAMYFKFQNTVDTPSPDSISRGNSVNDFLALDGEDGIDWLRIPIITGPSYDTTDADKYSKNVVTFIGTTASVEQVGESPSANEFSHAENSKIFSVALVAAPNKDDKTQDVIFARTNISPFAAQDNGYNDLFWSITFS